MLFTVLQTDKTRTLPNIPSLLKKKISSSRRYSKIAQQLLWTELPICLHFKVQLQLGHSATLETETLPSSEKNTLGLPCWCLGSPHILLLPSPFLLPASPTHMHAQSKKAGREKSKTLALSPYLPMQGLEKKALGLSRVTAEAAEFTQHLFPPSWAWWQYPVWRALCVNESFP